MDEENGSEEITEENEEREDKESKTISSDLIRGHINTIILRALYDGDKYGYAIIAEIERKSHGQYTLKQPSLYSALKRLEKDGYVSSYWGGSVAGGRRKYFSLTEEGREIAETNQAEWEYSRTVIDSLISDKAFDFNNPAPTAVNMRVLRNSTSRVPSRGEEDDDLDYEPSFDDSEEAGRLAAEYAEKNADLEAQKAALAADRARFEEEVAARNAAYLTERDWRERELAAREQELEEKYKAIEAEREAAEAGVRSRYAEEYADFEEETAQFEERVRQFEEREENFRKEVEEAEDNKKAAFDEEESERRRLLEDEEASRRAALDEELAERKAMLDEVEASRKAALDEEEASRRAALDDEENVRRQAFEEEEAERRRILEDEELERRTALDDEEAARKAALEEEEAERRAALDEEENRRKAALEEEENKRKAALDEEFAARAKQVEEAEAALKARLEEEAATRDEKNAEHARELRIRDEELQSRTAFYTEERNRYNELLRQRDEQLAKERAAHAAELTQQREAIIREQETIFRERTRQMIHQNYRNLVNSAPQVTPDSYYTYYNQPYGTQPAEPAAPPLPEPEPVYRERNYRDVLTDICAGAASGETPKDARALDGIAFDDIGKCAAKDGIRVVTVGGASPKKASDDSHETVHRGKALFFSAVVLFCLCVIEGAIVWGVQSRFSLPFFYPYVIWLLGLAVLLVTGLAYVNRYGERSLRRKSPVLINTVVAYALAVILTLIVALGVNIDFTSASALATFVVVPIIFFFGIVVFGVCYYFLTRPRQ